MTTGEIIDATPETFDTFARRARVPMRSHRVTSRAIPFTAASLARAIKGVEQAGRFVVGVQPDGTLIVADRPVDMASLVKRDDVTSETSEDLRKLL